MSKATGLVDRYRFFRSQAGGVVGQSAVYAITLARAEIRAAELDLGIVWDNEFEPYDGEGNPPKFYVCAYVPHPIKSGHSLAALGGIGFDSWADPYRRVVTAELYHEAISNLQGELNAAVVDEIAELANRATYAGC